MTATLGCQFGQRGNDWQESAQKKYFTHSLAEKRFPVLVFLGKGQVGETLGETGRLYLQFMVGLLESWDTFQTGIRIGPIGIKLALIP